LKDPNNSNEFGLGHFSAIQQVSDPHISTGCGWAGGRPIENIRARTSTVCGTGTL
jgi:hypothetical protein